MAAENYRIIRLEAENVKRIRAVEISPTGDVIEIAGDNGQGKTSVLDSILWAMAGGREIQWKPIREGEQKAKIVLDLGNEAGELALQVTRTFTAQEGGGYSTKLKVTNAEGFKPDAPQDLLNAMVGALSFDPSGFIRAKPDAQVKILKELIEAIDPDADFDAIEKRRSKAYDERTLVNREEKGLRSSADGMTIPDDAPTAPIEIQPLYDQMTKIGELGRAFDRITAERQKSRDSIVSKRAEAEQMRSHAEDLDHEADRLEGELEEMVEPVEPPDADSLRQEIADAQKHNDLYGRRRDRDNALKAADEKKATAERLTAEIDAAAQETKDLIARAKLPVNGLELGPDSVMLRGVPFNQGSDAEQLRASLALAMAANPRLRVIRIRDGSLLDKNAMKVIREVAASMHYQIWMERVGEGSGTGEVIVMENGSVAGG